MWVYEESDSPPLFPLPHCRDQGLTVQKQQGRLDSRLHLDVPENDEIILDRCSVAVWDPSSKWLLSISERLLKENAKTGDRN